MPLIRKRTCTGDPVPFLNKDCVDYHYRISHYGIYKVAFKYPYMCTHFQKKCEFQVMILVQCCRGPTDMTSKRNSCIEYLALLQCFVKES